jgi:hypothetical protein
LDNVVCAFVLLPAAMLVVFPSFADDLNKQFGNSSPLIFAIRL